ncbi:hypothetical protein [Pyramidobacter sp.]|nr:hypothetical protein [Pyramidobacter sp.]MDY3212697.1 hypothetical protein [Pyramidobacter sp.]
MSRRKPAAPRDRVDVEQGTCHLGLEVAAIPERMPVPAEPRE